MKASLTTSQPMRQTWMLRAQAEVQTVTQQAAPGLLLQWLTFYRKHKSSLRKDSGALRQFYTRGNDRARVVRVVGLRWQVSTKLPQVSIYPGPPVPGSWFVSPLIEALPTPDTRGS